jgi:SAM-dependent methyltransferase
MPADAALDCHLPSDRWARINRVEAFESATLAAAVAPFPPVELMQNVSGVTTARDFASQGADFWLAFSAAAPKPLPQYRSILDCGCGCGRFARLFKGYRGRLAGCDIDARHVAWVDQHLDYVEATTTEPDRPLPYPDASFELVVQISVLTHLNERSQDTLLGELRRVTAPDGVLMLTVHGERAMQRALEEKTIWDMISVEQDRFDQARARFDAGELGFILQQGHLTTGQFEYGITFTPRSYIREHWGRWFEVRDQVSGAIHDFQDIVILAPR